MKKIKPLTYYFTVFIFFCLPGIYAQGIAPDTIALKSTEFTISYSIDTHSAGGIAETYNGGIKTVFIKGDDIRIRQVSLMRMQSVFIKFNTKNRIATIVKESGKDRYKVSLDTAGWNFYNKEYKDATCEFFNSDSLAVLNINCKKAVITLAGGEEITAYYYPVTQSRARIIAEPLFACIPGIVLKYEYIKNKNSITYTAQSISAKPIAEDVFKIPSKGYIIKKMKIN